MKERLDEQTMALRVARELQDGWYVNLGFGIPALCTNFIPENKTIFFFAENGLLGFGRNADYDEAGRLGWRYVDAAAHPVLPVPGMAVFDYAEAFDMIRGGHIDCTVLGGLQVSGKGDLANWRLPIYKGKGGTIGGAMDLAACCKRVFVVMTHTEKSGKPKIVRECTYPLTAKGCVDLIVTDIAVIRVTERGLTLEETAPGWIAAEVQELTEASLEVSPNLRVMEL
ncbi:MAG: 3-oxoacid CoA-transferase subunit B [Chloroflexota bacterium]